MSSDLHWRRAFTLIELMVATTILLLIAGMIVGVGFRWLERSKINASIQRVDAVVVGLKESSGLEGSICARLQQTADLGGVADFALLPDIYAQVRKGRSGDWGKAGLTSGAYGGGVNGRYFPPPIFYSGAGYLFKPELAKANNSANDFSASIKNVWKVVIDVMPPAAGPIPANYGTDSKATEWGDSALIDNNWYVDQWPYVWPRTDWDQEMPGAVPPVLRFPWGSHGLTLDGQRVDPEQATDTLVGSLGSRFTGTSRQTVQVKNGWAVVGTRSVGNTAHQASMSYTDLPANEQAQAVYGTRSDGTPAPVVGNRREPFDAGLMSPLATMALLQASGLLPQGDEGLTLYRSDRSPDKPWNDKWGHPLVIGYALFQPERFQVAGASQHKYKPFTRQRAHMLKMCKERYGHNRSLYLVGGAVGKRLAPEVLAVWDGRSAWSPSDDDKVLRALWRQVREVCQLHQWNEDVQAGEAEPSRDLSTADWVSVWKGYRWGKKGSMQSMTTGVYEVQ